MRYLFDTSVLVPALVKKHPKHELAFPWVEKAVSGKISWAVAAHSLAETYGVLSALPLSPRIAPATARMLIRENIEKSAQIVELSAADYAQVLDDVAMLGIAGGTVYDALIFRAGQVAKVDAVLTFNRKDFLRVAPRAADKIVSPT